jgi:hypothetical protein
VGRGRPISSTITSWLTSGRPRQFIEIALNSRGSIRLPLGGPWRQVADGDLQPGLGREPGQLGLPGPHPVALAAASVGGDQQPAAQATCPWWTSATASPGVVEAASASPAASSTA